MARKKRRDFSREFKLEAVRKVLVDDRAYKDVGNEIGVSEGVLGRWVREFSLMTKRPSLERVCGSLRTKRFLISSVRSKACAKNVTF